ncbi:MAG TPA: hypothetical protein VEB59_06505, partial [Gemmatimonadales bacterium]|nr:hypothetical protein [Gemmatimonadales bacterium]
MLVAFLHLHRRTTHVALPAVALAACVTGCAAGAAGGSPEPAPAPGALSVEMMPRVLHEGQAAALVVRSPGADSIAFESENGIDRYWAHGGELRTTITADFGDRVPVVRYAGAYRGRQ